MRERRINPDFIEWLADEEPDAFLVLAVTRLRHPGEQYCHVPNMLMFLLGWNHEKRVKVARKVLLDLGLLEMITPATGNKRAVYRFAPGVSDRAPLPIMPTMH